MRTENSAQLIPTIARNLDKHVYEVYAKMKYNFAEMEAGLID